MILYWQRSSVKRFWLPSQRYPDFSTRWMILHSISFMISCVSSVRLYMPLRSSRWSCWIWIPHCLMLMGIRKGKDLTSIIRAMVIIRLSVATGWPGALLKIEFRNGTDYSSTGVVDFLQPLLNEFLTDYPNIPLLLRGDSGFATLDLYKQCETNGTSYSICLKENSSLRKPTSDIEGHLFELTKNDKVSYAVADGGFMYQTRSQDYPRRVVCIVEKQEGQLVHIFTFIIANIDSSPEELIRF